MPMPFQQSLSRLLSTFALIIVVASFSYGLFSCQIGATKDSPNKSAVEKSSQAPELPAVVPQKGIRQIDFANFDYDWYPKGLRPPKNRRRVTLHSGGFEVEPDDKSNITGLLVKLGSVTYSDLTGDGQEEAVIYLAGSVPMNSFLGSVSIYGLEDGRPKLLWRHETGDRGDGGLRAFRVQDGTFILEEYSKKANFEESLCCPKQYLRTHLKWNGHHFQTIKSEVLQNEYPNAVLREQYSEC